MKIFTVVGARPQFIKAAVVSRALRQRAGYSEILVHTGQHFDENMSEVFFKEMEIPKPDHFLEIHSMSHGKMTGKMLEGLEALMMRVKPDAVLVYGDTNSTLAGALAAAKLHIPIAHVEAGLRSFNMKMPEEINRILTDRISKWLFCPTQTAITNLKREGYESGLYMSGDVMQDAALYYKSKSRMPALPGLESGTGFILATVHREENTHNSENLRSIIGVLNTLHKTVMPVVVPLHPGTKKKIQAAGLSINFIEIDPVGYFEMIGLIEQSQLILTDSGGLQKEAYFFGKYCITMREQTEWIELVEHDVNQICGTDKNCILNQVNLFLNQNFPEGILLYGNGDAGEKIVNQLGR
jgi:UDP-GlcNAc3NAcA epimerase